MSTAIVLDPEQGQRFWLVGDHPTIKVDAQQSSGVFDACINWVAPGNGPPLHIHRREDELFYILEGSALFMQNGRSVTAGSGSTVYLEKDIAHTFKSIGKGPLRFIVVTVPSGFAAFVRECGEPIQTIPSGYEVTPAAIEKLLRVVPRYGLEVVGDPLPNGATASPISTASHPCYWVMGHLVTIKLTSDSTRGNFCVAEVASPPGASVLPHRHRVMDEFFYVVEGEYEFLVDGKPSRALPGTFIHIPPGTSHGFRNAGSTLARLADFHTPGGFERFFQESGVPCTDPTQAPPPPAEPPDPQQLAAFCARHGMEIA
jgi:mannose-6-phosphate isomerase-like protein (cupin superfamily)